MKKRIVLSLFDGISCGQIAMERAGISYDRWYSSDINEYVERITTKNYPDTIHVGDITKWREWDIDWSQVDVLLAGFACQAWSLAGGGQLGVKDPRGALVYDLIDIWKHVTKHNPNVTYLFENVKMAKDNEEFLNTLFDTQPIKLNSALVSCQNRKRLYWTNIPDVSEPADKGIMIKDILIEGEYETFGFGLYFPRRCRNYYQFDVSGKGYNSQQYRAYYISGKFGCLPNARAITKIKIATSPTRYRNLTLNECESLQNVPHNYTFLDDGFSLNKSVSALGNGWTVDIITHFFKAMKLS